MKYPFNKLALGGTFDYLHLGHEALLDFAFKNSRQVSVGITSDEFAQSQKTNVRKLKVRFAELHDFLKNSGYEKRAKVVVINDIYGPAISDKSIDGILVTKLTEDGAKLINAKRSMLKLPPLKIIKFPILKAQDNKLISSSRIKNGQINRNGIDYFSEIGGKDFILPEDLRNLLSKPHGRLFANINKLLLENPSIINNVISIGDRTTQNFLEKKVAPRLSIVDLKVNRKIVFDDIYGLGFNPDQKFVETENEPGTINNNLSLAINDYFVKPSNNFVVKVLGEEDLAVLPAVILAPLGWYVVYGQPGEGLILISITEKTKADFLNLLEKFRSS